MLEGAVVEDGRREGIGAVDKDGAAAQRFEHGDGDCVTATKGSLLYCLLRGGVLGEDEISLGTVAR